MYIFLHYYVKEKGDKLTLKGKLLSINSTRTEQKKSKEQKKNFFLFLKWKNEFKRIKGSLFYPFKSVHQQFFPFKI